MHGTRILIKPSLIVVLGASGQSLPIREHSPNIRVVSELPISETCPRASIDKGFEGVWIGWVRHTHVEGAAIVTSHMELVVSIFWSLKEARKEVK